MIRRIVPGWFLFLILAAATPAWSYGLSSVAENMDNYFLPAFPPAYGEIIDRLPPEQVGDIPKVLKALEIFGYLKTLGDVANRLDAGDKTGAALDTAMAATSVIVNLLKDEATKKVMVAGVGISTIPVTALLTTLDITRKSFEAVQASRTALELERLHYSIIVDPILRVKGRKLGEGDPIRIDATSIEHLWRRVLFNDTWRNLFKTYVTTELNQEWPEPSLWERLTIKSDHLDEALLLEEAKRLKAHIRALLGEINKVAKADEARVILAQELKAMAALAGRLSPEELAKALLAHSRALQQLPVIDTYVKELAGRVDNFRTRLLKANVAELMQIREREIMNELATITSHAATIRGLNPKGRQGAIREDLLKKLRAGYQALAQLRGSAGRAVVNARLVEEAQKLTLAGTEFIFTRHACTRIFEDVSASFAAQVVRGEPGAPEAVNRAMAEIQKNLDELRSAYGRDRANQDKKYQEKRAELEAGLARLHEELRRTSDVNQSNRLRAAIDRLQAQLSQLIVRYEKYVALFNLHFNADVASCQGALQEIESFVRENTNRQGVVRAGLDAAYNDASAKSWELYLNTQTGHRRILSADELTQLEKLLKEAADSYAGLSFDFLKAHLKNDAAQSKTKNLLDTLTGMTEALRTYFESLMRYRLTWYPGWEKNTIPSLRFMSATETREAVEVVLEAIDNALTLFQQTDPADFAATFRQNYDEKLAVLRHMRRETELLLPRLARSQGLADRLAAYADRALRNNAAIAEDSARIMPVLRAFHRARQSLSVLYATFLMDSQYEASRTLPSGQLRSLLEESRVLSWSQTLELGLAEEFLKEPFVTVRTPEGPADVLRDHFRDTHQRIGRAPVNEIAGFFYFLRDTEGMPGFLIQRLLGIAGRDFQKMFQAEELLAREAANLQTFFNNRQELAFRNQRIIDERKARFDAVLIRANHFLEQIRRLYDARDFQGAAAFETFLGDVRGLYDALGDKRKDVDDAFAAIDSLIAEAKRQVSQAAAAQVKVIQDFYAAFRQAYESRNASQVMSMLDDGWQAGDGTTLSDMQTNLMRSFRTFDEVRFNLQNLRIQPQGRGRFVVSYDLTLTSRILRRNIRHEERSSVHEEVTLNDRGQPKITRTLTGQFWFSR